MADHSARGAHLSDIIISTSKVISIYKIVGISPPILRFRWFVNLTQTAVSGPASGIPRPAHGRTLERLPSTFVDETHALEWPGQPGSPVGLASEVGQRGHVARRLRRRFQIVGIDLHGDALHDNVQRKHNPQIVFLADQDAFHAGHRSGLDADPIADDEVGMGRYFPQPDSGAERLDFKIGERREGSPKTNQRKHPRHFKHTHPFPGIDPHKYIICKKGEFKVHLATVPPASAS
jgi:hypothetical protein